MSLQEAPRDGDTWGESAKRVISGNNKCSLPWMGVLAQPLGLGDGGQRPRQMKEALYSGETAQDWVPGLSLAGRDDLEAQTGGPSVNLKAGPQRSPVTAGGISKALQWVPSLQGSVGPSRPDGRAHLAAVICGLHQHLLIGCPSCHRITLPFRLASCLKIQPTELGEGLWFGRGRGQRKPTWQARWLRGRKR